MCVCVRFAKLSINRIVPHFFLVFFLYLGWAGAPQGRAAETKSRSSRMQANRVENIVAFACGIHGPSKATCITMGRCYFSLCGCAWPVTTFANCTLHTITGNTHTHARTYTPNITGQSKKAERKCRVGGKKKLANKCRWSMRGQGGTVGRAVCSSLGFKPTFGQAI